MIDLKGLEEFYELLISKGFISDLSMIPPAHITLYTQNCSRGIGVQSTEVLSELSKKIIHTNELLV